MFCRSDKRSSGFGYGIFTSLPGHSEWALQDPGSHLRSGAAVLPSVHTPAGADAHGLLVHPAHAQEDQGPRGEVVAVVSRKHLEGLTLQENLFEEMGQLRKLVWVRA